LTRKANGEYWRVERERKQKLELEQGSGDMFCKFVAGAASDANNEFKQTLLLFLNRRKFVIIVSQVAKVFLSDNLQLSLFGEAAFPDVFHGR